MKGFIRRKIKLYLCSDTKIKWQEFSENMCYVAMALTLFTLMGNFDWGPISRTDIVSRKIHVSRNKKIKEVIKAVYICKSAGK